GAGAQSKANAHGEATEEGSHKYVNRLAKEKSPYLLQHAHNPVDWYPWGEEAFEKARREQKPIFLSVGYSTCHWCHVMERESFSDPAMAEIMNRDFVSIKVDREERPDVDRIYMTYVQAATGSGGWPMSVFLTPDLKPFYGGTYFPPEDRYGRIGFRTLLLRIAEVWEKDRAKVIASADRATQAIQAYAEVSGTGDGALQPLILSNAYEQFRKSYDATYGGFGEAPKFPRPVIFNFLLRYYARTGQQDALDMTLQTLRAMARGGIHDHVGGGFHRYSTDPTWHVPHFEKMLYDQAQLAVSYTEAYQITHDPFFAEVARDILGYVLRDMRSPEGGFYSAEDADSLLEHGKPEHAEGAFYVWEAAEIMRLLGPETAAVLNHHYGVEPSGNVPARQDIQGELKGRNILIVRHSAAETAKKFGKSTAEVEKLLAQARGKLFQARAKRPRPLRDDKVLTAWNGLMISAMARASQALEEPKYRQAAEAAAGFIQKEMYNAKTGELQRRHRESEAAIRGFLEDYAYLIQGLTDLYEASFDVRWLQWAVRLQEKQDELFWDAAAGGYFSTTGKDSSILFRMREDYDGAEPAGNSVAALNLLRLGEITDRDDWRKKARQTFAVFGKQLEGYPQSLPQLVAALGFALSKPKQIIIAGEPGGKDTQAMLRLVHDRFLPNKVLLLADGGRGQEQLSGWLPFVKFVTRKDGRATAYVCENYVCKLPTTDPEVAARLLDGKT
ncbi:MAG: thioredoxin domain-containing protein, partial [Candidatus Acidiferrales bacterium]